ncbi:MAG: hypothetical protein V1745_02645 [Patescibacteria group bacterium]
MSLISWADGKMKKLDWMDMALTKVSCFAFGALIVALIPQILEINIWWIVATWLVFAARPLYRFFK